MLGRGAFMFVAHATPMDHYLDADGLCFHGLPLGAAWLDGVLGPDGLRCAVEQPGIANNDRFVTAKDDERRCNMKRINSAKNGLEARLPRIETDGADNAVMVDAPLRQAVTRYREVRARCAAHMASSEGMDPAFQTLDRERRQAIQAVMAISAFGLEGVKAKLEVLKSVHAWCGPDESLVPLAMDVAEEAVAYVARVNDLHDKRAGSPSGWTGAGRWLMGAAASVPAFIVDRFGLG
jgi:hypothetical protein